MFRRSRFSIRPNVGTTGRTAGTPQEASSASQEASKTPKDVSESSTATAVTDDKSVVTPSEKPTAPGDGNDQNVEGTSSSAAVQRRKRFSIKPKVAPGRPSTLARTPKSPVKAVSQTPIEVPVSDLDKPSTATPPRLQSPRRRRSSEESKQPKMQPKPTLIPSDSSEPSAVPTAEDSPEQSCVGFSSTNLQADSGKELESASGSQVEEVPSRPPDKVPLSLPDKEAIALSEKAKTLVSSKSGVSLSPPAFSLSRLLNDPSDLQRLAKARKLRELLKQEMHKEKKIKKANARAKEYTLDPAKMTMRDLIRYLPVSNPMTSSLEDSAQENETVVPPSPVREASPERAQEPEVLPKIASPREEDEGEAEAEAEEEQDDDDVMVPQVKVAEDGSLIIDEESLTVEVLRAKGPNPAQGRDPIFERGSTTTYSSFRKGTYSKPWSNEETDMFFLAISMVGTDFSMICQLFPHRARSEIKNKFKKEERANSWRIDKAFKERRKLDIEYFSKLLEKILEVQKNRKKLKSLAGKKSPKKQKKKPKDKKSARKLSVVEEEDEEEQNEMPDLEEEGEKENEDLCNEGGTTVAKPKKKRKRKDASTEEPNDKKNKTGEKSSEQDEAYIPGDTEAALPEDRPTSDMSEKTDSVNEAKDATIKPAKLSRGRAPKPLLPLGRKWGKKAPPPSTKTSDAASDNGDESMIDEASKEQEVNKDASPLSQANKRKSANDDSEEEDATVQLPRPTRYGRVPKPTKLLNYPAKEAASETTPASPEGSTASAARPKPKCTAKRGRSSKQQSAQESKKPKLVTLRASQSEDSDEGDEQQREQEEEEEVEEDQHAAWSSSKDSAAPVFVPASLRSPRPVISEVEETMEELDILANMPDVLGISQDALCPDASFDLVHNETGTAEACEHQLDLLVDVIDFLSSDHAEVTEDESYNEAAQTLLTIGNLAHLPQSAQNQIAIQDHISGTTSVIVNETSQHLEEEIASTSAAQEENSATPLMSATSVYGVTETSETDTAVELQNSTADNDDIPVIESSDQRTGSDIVPTPQLHSSPESSKTNSPQTKRGRLSKVKPKPNLGQASRTAQSKSQPATSTERTAEESHTVAPDLCQVTETLSAAEETPKIAACSRTLLKDEMSCIEVKPAEEPSGSQKRSVGQLKSGTATSNQSASENQNLSEAEQAASDSTSASESTDKLLMSHVGTIKSSCNSQVTSGTAVTEAQIGRGSNIDSAPVQESSDYPAPCVTPVEELPDSQEDESEVGSARQTRTSRFQKVKPRVIIAKTSRTARSKPQTTKDTVEKDSNPTPHPKFHEKTIVEVEAEPTCTTSPEKPSQCPGPASDLTPLLDLGSSPTPTEELSTTGEKKTDVGVVVQVESGASTSHQSASETQNLSEAQFEPSREQATRDTQPTFESADEVLMSPTTESSCNNPLTPDLPVTESQVGQGSNIDSVPVQKSSDHPVTPVEELPVSHKEESEVGSTCQTRKSRFQKVKPKVNLPQTLRTARSKPQTTKDTVEKDSNPTPNPKFHEKTIAEVEAEPPCTTSLEKPSQSLAPASDLIPSLDLGSTLTPTEELSTTEEKKTDVGVVGQAESGAATSDQRASETQNVSEAQFEPDTKEATRDTTPTLESTDEKLVGTTESRCSNPQTSDSAVTESQVGQRSNIDSAPVQESSDHPVTPVEELPVSHKEESEVGSTPQTRTSRFQRVKPKVNLVQSSRTAHSKPQTTRDTVAKDSNQTPHSEFNDKKIVEVEAEPTCTTSPEKPSQSPGAASDLIPSLDLGLILTPIEELSTIEEKKTNVGCVGQAESGAATSQQSASENQNLSEAQFDPSRQQSTRDTTPTLESTNEVLMFHVGTTESSCNNLLTSESAVTESQVGQGSNIVSSPVSESNDHPAQCVTPVEELPVSQKEESEVGSTRQTRTSRFQRVKPKVNLVQSSRTARSKPQTTKDTVEKDCNPTPNPKVHEKTIAKVEAEPACTTSPEKTNQSPGPASDLIPSLDLGSTLTPTEELSTTEEKKTDVGVGQAESGAATSDQSASETQNLSEAQFEPSREQATRDTTPSSVSTHEVLMSHVGTTESRQVTSDPEVTESQVGQGSPKDSAPVQESSDHSAPPELPVSLKEESEVKPTRQTTRGRLLIVKPKPNLSQTSRTVRSKPQTTEDPVTPMQLADTPSSPTSRLESTDKMITEVEAQPTCSSTPPETPSQITSTGTASVPEDLSSMEEQKTDVGCGQGSKSEGPEQNVSQRRRRFSNVKPNLGSSPRTTRTKLQSNDISKPSEQSNMDTSLTSEQQPADNNNAQTERVLADSKHLTSTRCSLHTELLSSTKSLDSTNDKGTSSAGVVIATSWIAETQSVLTESVLENKSSEKPTVEGESKEDRTSNTDTVESGPASQWDCKQDMSIGVTETKTAVSDLQKSSQDGSAESKSESTLPTNTQSAPDPKESIHQPRSENDSEAQNQEALQQCSETNQTNQSEPTDSPSRKAPQTRRGRLIKPQPRLGLSRRPPQPQQVQNAKQADADCGTHSEGLDASVCHKLVSEHQPDIKEPVEGAVGPLFSNQNSSQNVAGSSLGCVTQVADNDTQDASTSSTGATQSLPSFTIIQDTLSQQEPSDPEEPFFILSLTEIPVGPSGEVAGSVPEPLPYLPVTDASIEQQSIPGDSSAAAGDGPVSDVAVPVSVEESDVTGLINVKDIGPDPAAYGWNKENPVDPHESTAVHPSKLPETVEKNDETEIPPTKQRGTRRREAQVKPNITKRKQASKTLAAKEAESITIQTDTTQHPELPGPSVQSKACDDVVTEPQTGSGDHADVEKETRAVREDPEGSSSGAQTTRTRATSIQQRRAKDFLPFISETNNAAPASDSPPGKAASKGRKVRAPRAAGKRSAPAPVASTSHDDAPTRSATQPTEETHSASSTTSQTEPSRLRSVTTPCPAEVSASQPCVESSSIEEEPTNVSQYFLSDIFTEVDEA
ncbi:transcription factor TFIIIB component B'' homolog isoform X2 [Sebastes umbrosus]|uniref:transcription factor TFIIIB component B'' homolog isoform X2 n=1 Tax=Sebastes umbrosus TaxID=72105 RepID=UPI00189DE0EA|nr:transcription factor TFIIIB component B'' homolog isoform X2 [Sebastes umbrosus]